MAKDEYPEDGELVLGTVNNIFSQGAFIDLDEYPGRRGMLHLSEISLKWVRNIRDYVKEGQKVVLMVLRTDPKRGHIDLSLRRVSDAARKNKLQEVKQRQRAKKLTELLASELKVKPETAFKKIYDALSDYESLYAGMEAVSADPSAADDLGLEDKWRKKFVELVEKSIKPPSVEITGYVELRSYEPDGVVHVRNALEQITKHKPKGCEMGLTYVSAPTYRVTLTASDYKTAEKAMRKAVDQGISYIEGHQGSGVFHRELEEK